MDDKQQIVKDDKHLEMRKCIKCGKDGWVGSFKNEKEGSLTTRLFCIMNQGPTCKDCVE